MNYNAVNGRLPVDTRLVRKLSDSPGFNAGGINVNYGSVDNYIQFARLPQNERLVLAAKMEGYANTDEISVATGLSVTDVNRSLTNLYKDGIVDKETVALPK